VCVQEGVPIYHGRDRQVSSRRSCRRSARCRNTLAFFRAGVGPALSRAAGRNESPRGALRFGRSKSVRNSRDGRSVATGRHPSTEARAAGDRGAAGGAHSESRPDGNELDAIRATCACSPSTTKRWPLLGERLGYARHRPWRARRSCAPALCGESRFQMRRFACGLPVCTSATLRRRASIRSTTGVWRPAPDA